MKYCITFKLGARIKQATVQAEDFFQAAQRICRTYQIKNDAIINNIESGVNVNRRNNMNRHSFDWTLDDYTRRKSA